MPHYAQTFAITLCWATRYVSKPLGYFLGSALGVINLTSQCIVYFHAINAPYAFIATGFTIALIFYYLFWKYLVGFFNRVLGIA